MRVIAEESWSWLLFFSESDQYLSVLCGSVGLYSIDLQLMMEETEQISRLGSPYVTNLAQAVRSNPAAYQERHIPDFHNIPGVTDAVATWRMTKPAEA